MLIGWLDAFKAFKNHAYSDEQAVGTLRCRDSGANGVFADRRQQDHGDQFLSSLERILTTNINLDDGACDLDLVLSVSDYFGLKQIEAKRIVKEVAQASMTWRDTAEAAGSRPGEIRRMGSAFEHDDLEKALRL